MNNFLKIIFLFLFLFGCATNSLSLRAPSSATDEISHYLAVDKFKYYINEYSVAMEGKIPDIAISTLRNLSVEEIMSMNLPDSELADAQNYDHLIYQYLASKEATGAASEEQLKWNYNFFRNKLNEAFALTPSKLDIDLAMKPKVPFSSLAETLVPIENYATDDMTLDSGHYISNRTTRAIFWDAIEHDHPIEFHLGDSRTFLKGLKVHQGEILYEVRPLAKNYNKIFIIQYPGEHTYRYAITNIGGKDRLNHLTNQLSLSNLSHKNISPKVFIDGDVQKFQDAKTLEHTAQLRLLPKADRVIIGQKESIDGKFYIFWKMKALKNLYDEEPDLFSKIDPKLFSKYQTLEKSNIEAIFKDKKIIEDVYETFASELEQRKHLLPPQFKVYNYDNFTIEMCDYIFTNSDGKEMRWRVLSNVWGDEIVPIAKALKNTGHTNVTYMGTAGAFADKGYKVGDLVVPNQKNPIKIEGAKYGGHVEHVGSPFEETKNWLAAARTKSEFVEVETSYLQEIFHDSNDHLEMYLLISDILGSDTETLAHATSSKRKNSQNKLLAAVFERDTKTPPIPMNSKATTILESKRNLIMKAIPKKSVAYQYYIYSKIKYAAAMTEEEIIKLAEKEPTFTDKFLIDRLVLVGEILQDLSQHDDFEIAFSKDLVLGTWNPKNEKLQIIIKAKNTADEKILNDLLASNQEFHGKISAFANFKVATHIDSPELIWMRRPEKIDPDFFVKIYSQAGFLNAGLYQSITYNGNITLDMLPTRMSEEPLAQFYQGTPIAHTGNSCMDMVKNLISNF
jgi:hypothetical protein